MSQKQHHPFLIEPGLWLGEGKIQLNMVAEELNFVTRWNTQTKDGEGKIESAQEIQIKGLSDVMQNAFILSAFHGEEFEIELENEALGKVKGKGLISEKMIAWEFRV